MRRRRRIAAAAAAAVALALAGAPGQARPAAEQASPAATAESFHAEIGRLYKVEGGALQARGGTEAVAGLLDAFWKKVKGDRAAYLPLLRAELARADNPPFFYFDGGELLRSLSDERSDGELALAALDRVDFTHLDPSGYLIAVNFYTSHGYDTRRAALRWLDLPKDTTIVVQPFPHIFYYSRLEAMIFSLFGMEEKAFVGDLIARVEDERDDFRIFYLLHCIWATATPQGRAALAAYADDPAKPGPARKYAREMLDHKSSGPAPAQSEEELRRKRREIVARPFVHDSFKNFHALTDDLVRVAR